MTKTPPISIMRGGRQVVLKKLDDDCLLDGQLHPSIKLRLERVRELPVRCVANFLGVERDASTGRRWRRADDVGIRPRHAAG
jgi:hypothetical protein